MKASPVNRELAAHTSSTGTAWRLAELSALALVMLYVYAETSPGIINLQVSSKGLVLAIETIADAALDRGNLVDMPIVGIEDDPPVQIQVSGHADLEHLIQVTPEARFHLGSLTKTFSAAATMRMVELGLLGLDDEVSQHLNEPDNPEQSTVLRQFLDHASGPPRSCKRCC